MFQAHGNIDPLVSPVFGELTSKFLKTTSSKHTYKTYPMMHSSCEEVSIYVSFVARKPVFEVSDQVRHNPGGTATEDG